MILVGKRASGAGVGSQAFALPIQRTIVSVESMKTPKTILVVEDEADLRELIGFNLEREGYRCRQAADGEEALAEITRAIPDLVILDRMLPNTSGDEVLSQIRRDQRTAAIPVLMLTAKADESDELVGFAMGADDYVTKPFHTEELLARLRALLRRAAGHSSPLIEIGDLSVDTRSARAYVNGDPIKLTSHEFRLLRYLAHHPGDVISRTELVEHIYDQDFDRDSNTIEVFVGRLRKKIGSDRIETVRGLGYRLIDPGGADQA